MAQALSITQTLHLQAVPFFRQDYNAGVCSVQDALVLQSTRDACSTEPGSSDRISKVNELGLEWLTDLMERTETAHDQVPCLRIQSYETRVFCCVAR